jgi:hypothetical protein
LHYPEIAMPNEIAIGVSSRYMDRKTWLIILTNKRVIFLDKGMFFGLKQIEINLSSISSVGGRTRILYGEIIIGAGEHTYSIANVPKKNVIPFTNLIKQAMEDLNQENGARTAKHSYDSDDSVDKLERLASLKERGLLTEEEFQKQKDKILG